MRFVVRLFANAMELKLSKNDHKGGRASWNNETVSWHLKKLDDEVEELKDACSRLRLGERPTEQLVEEVLGEAADVANFAMFIADVAGCLPKRSETVEAKPEAPAPIPMLIWCPMCSGRHIDTGEFATKSHHTHSCQHCGHTWRPSIVPTVGVQFLPGFKNAGEP